ncbi:hypothetical protein Tco_0098115 [Tanacetum coccineum]
MDWWTRVLVGIDCLAIIVRIPLEGGRILGVQGDRSGKDLKLVSAIKMRKIPGEELCHIFSTYSGQRNQCEEYPKYTDRKESYRGYHHIGVKEKDTPRQRSGHVFIDDNSIYSRSKEEHKQHLDTILRFLKEEKWAQLDMDYGRSVEKSAHFLLIREDYKLDKLAELHFNEIESRHAIPISIILDRTDGQSERMIQTMEDMLRACVIDLGEAAKFVRDFKSLAKETDESLAKHKALNYKIERLLRAVVSQDIMSIMHSNSVVDTSNLQTELDSMKEKLETCIIKKEKEYVVLWNNWYKKCEECKYDKNLYDKTYNDMQQKIERLKAQLGDLKGKSQDTLCVSDTLDPLSHKLEDENVIPKVGETNALLKPVTSNSAPSTRESKVMKNDNQALGQNRSLHVTTKKDVSTNTNGLPSTGVESTAKTRRPQPKRNPKNDRILFASKSNNIKHAIQNDNSKVVCATCKQCLITANHDECVFKYVNGMNSSKKNQSANVSKSANQKKHKPNVKKSKKLGFNERLASLRPKKLELALGGYQLEEFLTFVEKYMHPATPSVSLTHLCVIMQVLLTPRNLQAKDFQILLLFLTGLRDSKGRIHVSIHLLFSKSV